ncbi:MAG: efflux RND transporter periplasmic adaptor subunit [Cytophagaceae bacterium]|nr:MAG: efflux RND transporter periplasmic adaptor subunit [Cytophagaceae bacterium]
MGSEKIYIMLFAFVNVILINASCVKQQQDLSNPSAELAKAGGAIEKESVRISQEAYQNAALRTAVVGTDVFLPRLETTAVISADPQRIAQVGSYMAGRVAIINVRLGDRVERGNPLIEVDSIEMHQVSTEYRTALAQAQQADDNLKRQEILAKEHVNSAQDLFRARTTAQQASATLDEAEEHLGFLGLDIATVQALKRGQNVAPLRSIVRSPIPGRVAAMSVSIGQVLGGKEQLITIMDTDPVWATLRLFESDIQDIKVGAEVCLGVPGFPKRLFRGKVAAISDLIDTTTRSVEVRARLDNADGSLKPGMSAVASMSLPSEGEGDWLPAEAVQQHNDHKVVFVQASALEFEPQTVVVSGERAGYVRVKPGLKRGCTIVVDGAFILLGELERASLGDD